MPVYSVKTERGPVLIEADRLRVTPAGNLCFFTADPRLQGEEPWIVFNSETWQVFLILTAEQVRGYGMPVERFGGSRNDDAKAAA